MNELLHLAPNVWPRNTTRDEVGVVCIAGIPLTQLAQEYGTPLFVIDEDDFARAAEKPPRPLEVGRTCTMPPRRSCAAK